MVVTDKRELKVTPNHSKRTFTLRYYYKDGTITKYRTIRLSKEEFESCQHNTKRDWNQFLKSDEYSLVK